MGREAFVYSQEVLLFRIASPQFVRKTIHMFYTDFIMHKVEPDVVVVVIIIITFINVSNYLAYTSVN